MNRGLALLLLTLSAACAHPEGYYVGEDDPLREGDDVINERPEAGDAAPAKKPAYDEPPRKRAELPPPPPDLLPSQGASRGIEVQPASGHARARAVPAATTTAIRPAAPLGGLAWPVDGNKITSPFGARADPLKSATISVHKGVDVRCAEGSPVHAAASGEVTFAGDGGSRGRTVELRHSERLTTVYAHLERIDVRIGQRVETGQVIGLAGETGRATGPHLHFEVWQDGTAVDPMGYFGKARNAAPGWLPEAARPAF